ncbi:hypothetical protein [Alcaligenes aquatilis]|uniref:Uncharacterized protein n=1 Tax=Alcaligenes aquatilis TaxID=323284 RepID=A0A3G2HX19_9BURK|nr:hypothetical protein [Alcaligenes aquatilis]AYN21615.1 hypothetical protein D3M96_14390 [Alcaligenes aquatilis]
MTYGVKLQIEASIAANKKNIAALETMLDVYGSLEPNGWTPDIYHQCVSELQRVQMCVLHRSVIYDALKLADQIQEELPDKDRAVIYDGDQPTFFLQDLEPLRAALESSLQGIPPLKRV